MYHKYHSRGIVLAVKPDFSDGRIIHLFTEDFGFLICKVESARTFSSKMRSAIQEYSQGEYSVLHTKGGWKVVGAKSSKNYFEIFRNSPEKVKVLANVSLLLQKLVSGEQKDEELFILVYNFFEFLINIKESEIFYAECLVILRILNKLGFLRHEIELNLPIQSNFFEDNMFTDFYLKKDMVISLINESLKAT